MDLRVLFGWMSSVLCFFKRLFGFRCKNSESDVIVDVTDEFEEEVEDIPDIEDEVPDEEVPEVDDGGEEESEPEVTEGDEKDESDGDDVPDLGDGSDEGESDGDCPEMRIDYVRDGNIVRFKIV